MEKIKPIWRWILFIPLSVIIGIISYYFIIFLFHLIPPRYPLPLTITSTAVAWGVPIVSAMYIVPSQKRLVGLILVIILFIVLLITIIGLIFGVEESFELIREIIGLTLAIIVSLIYRKSL